MKRNYFFLLIPFIPVMLILMAYSGGSPGGKSGSPGDGGNTCTDCHTGTSNPASGWITTNVPSEGYTPGATYTITATGTHSGVVKFGFELTVEDQSENKVGTLIVTNSSQTKLANGGNSVTHTSSGNTPSGNSKTWTMDWTAPSAGTGQVGFYAAFNAANGNGGTGGDVIYTSNAFVSEAVANPEIVGITPNNADQGETFTATITGENTSWSGSPNVSLKLSSNPSEVINATGVTVNNATTIMADFTIPVDATPGAYNVTVDNLTLNNGFTVIEIVQSLVSISPDDATQGEMIMAMVMGQNTQWDGTTPAVSLVYHNNPSDVITGTGVSVSDNTHLDVDFDFAADATVGMYDLQVDDLVLENAFTVEKLMYLTGVDPEMAAIGEDITVTIMAFGTEFTSGVSSVNLSLHSNPLVIIEAQSINVLDDSSLEADFMIPMEATLGMYDVNVDILSLENAFTIYEPDPELAGMFPNNATQGDSFTSSISGQYTHWMSGVTSVSLVNQDEPSEIVSASMIDVLSDNNLEATFNLPINARPGLWDLHVDDLMLESAFTVDAGTPAILGVDPNTGIQGVMVTTSITTQFTDFTTTAPDVSLTFHDDPLESILASAVNVISDTEVEVEFDIPLTASVGMWDLHVGMLELESGFEVMITTGINDPLMSSVTIFPNPSEGVFNLTTPENAYIEIFGLTGNMVYKNENSLKTNVIDLSGNPEGLYILRVVKDGSERIEKIVLR